jgi:hypothetical protein
VLERAKAVASAIVLSFMLLSLLSLRQGITAPSVALTLLKHDRLSAIEAAKLFTSRRAETLQQSSCEKIVVGAKVPSDLELVALPPDWGPSLTKYRYVYSGDRVMLVDPGTPTVVQEVD